jgi:hypothetical protein
VFHPRNREFCGVATAYHVLSHVFEWEETIKITHHDSGKSIILKNDKRVIFPYPQKDLAIVLFNKGELPIPDGALDLTPPKKYMKVGVEIGWCGFPSVSPNDLCFFAGHVSCYQVDAESYLIDGVAINGVSGGPAFIKIPALKKIFVGGVVSAYQPNTATGIYLSGVSIVRSVEPYQQDLEIWKNLEEAKEKEEEIKSMSQSASPSPSNSASQSPSPSPSPESTEDVG